MEANKKQVNPELLTPGQTQIIQELVNCALACEACSTACLAENNVAHLTRCIQLTRDCADICFQASRVVMRKSEVIDHILSNCEEICRVCADECRKHQHDHCQLCAEACDSCAESCNNYYQEQGV